MAAAGLWTRLPTGQLSIGISRPWRKINPVISQHMTSQMLTSKMKAPGLGCSAGQRNEFYFFTGGRDEGSMPKCGVANAGKGAVIMINATIWICKEIIKAMSKSIGVTHIAVTPYRDICAVVLLEECCGFMA